MLTGAIVAGVVFGLYYTLVGLGLNLVFGVMRIVNLAHGDFLMLGGIAAWFLFSSFGLHPLVAAYASEQGIVLDPFMGSGSTLRAAKDFGLAAVGIEIEERYCRYAANRMAQEILFPLPRN